MNKKFQKNSEQLYQQNTNKNLFNSKTKQNDLNMFKYTNFQSHWSNLSNFSNLIGALSQTD